MKTIDHTVKYTVEELKEIDKNGEAFRKYSQYFKLSSLAKENIEKLVNENIVIEVSNIGTIKVNDKIIKPFEREKGYFYVNLSDKLAYKVYRLVAETWVSFPFENTTGFDVHHIVNDGTINTAENLIWVDSNTHRHEIH
jgi:hypothetical protein